ncbi:hypothetical protein C7121_19895 [Paenibacillus glucanolyticus]|jgi:hypothetical protein|uniref:hypothetical protein n=1 Tax=Paenibacillus TaxID=44249 RepID=UPI0003E20AE1|nr:MULTISPECIES: hypothetical protein [Paenibacillus]AVV58227.1 hypothetical protein C7121_19895 [Paenibacillus glucanolyticus]ETT42985.1 hypothetical protein C169_03717 [Paenibacillus sp. FSL R5-808]MCA4756097.1 hypothetical protein [Mycolicibacterium fortuitum]
MKLLKTIAVTLAGICLLGIGCTGQNQGDETTQVQLEQSGSNIRVPHNERLHLSTDQKWIEQEGHQSDLIRLQWTAERAKPAIVWMDEKGKDKTAIISHDKANNPQQRDHKHISFETTMSPTGEYPNQLFTRFEIPFDTDVSEIRTHSSNFNVMSGILRVAGESGTNRDMQFSVAGEDNETTARWAIRADSSEESGDNSGADLQFVRYADDGEVVDSPLTVQRSSGHVGIGTNDPDTMLDVNGDKLRIREKYTPASSTDACSQGQMAWDEEYVYVCVTENKWKRTEISTW